MKRIICLCLGLLMVGTIPGKAAEAGLLKQIADIPLPGNTTRFDYASIDSRTGRLYFSHMGDGELMVFDTKTQKLIAHLPGFPTMTGVLAVPSLKRVYGSVTKKHAIAVVDTEKLEILKYIPDGKFPDGLAYSPETKKLFVSDESGEVETVIDTVANEKIATIAMGGEVGNTQYDPTSKMIFACVQTRNDFVAIDPVKNQIVARYKISGGQHPHGFYIDPARNKAYIACQGDAKLVVFDLANRIEEYALPCGDDPDVLAFDTVLNRLYVACEAGVVSIYDVDIAKSRLKKLADFPAGPNCHTVAIDSATHKVYLPLKNINGKPVLRIMLPGDVSRH